MKIVSYTFWIRVLAVAAVLWAVSVTIRYLLQAFKPTNEIVTLLQELDISPKNEIIVYCQTM